ncbi:hypothetical protein HXX76_003079 [Chlamydomonas incerta]|uniref:Protein kinase domain-containing protein n=1 Tax=Chlamydomonas incerta TaxID=51695 RepID=A0A835T9M1_CHLIN|nr:hypothetical protein HXX76_003079 [Chlamydomonas incerta]|eukprot:KAG2441457.1 hypothetical protein HXX76_003079 [Chlamydomonas incerta]
MLAWRGGSAEVSSDVTVPVANGPEFVAALLNSSVSTIEVAALDVAIQDSLFPGAGAGAGGDGTPVPPLLLSRSVAVVGAAGLPDLPILRLLATRALKLGRNVSLTFENVSLVTPQIDNLAWAPHLHILQPSDPGSGAVVALRGAVFFGESCAPTQPRSASLDALLALAAGARRSGLLPPDAPAEVDVAVNQRVPGCDNSSSSLARPTAPILQRCWPAGVDLFRYLGLPAQQLDESGAPQPQHYDFYLRRTYGICLRPLPSATAAPVVALGLAAPPPAAGSGGGGNADSGGGSSGSSTVGIIVGCVVGGCVALALLAAGAWAMHRRRQRSQQHHLSPSPGAGGSSAGGGGKRSSGGGKPAAAVAVRMDPGLDPERGVAAPPAACGGAGQQPPKGLAGREPHPGQGQGLELARLKGPDVPVLGSSPFRPDLNTNLVYVAAVASVAGRVAAPAATGGSDRPFTGAAREAADAGVRTAEEEAAAAAAGACWAAQQHVWVAAADLAVSSAAAAASGGQDGGARPSLCSDGAASWEECGQAGARCRPGQSQPPQEQQVQQDQQSSQEQQFQPPPPPLQELTSIPSITHVVTRGEIEPQHLAAGGGAGAGAGGDVLTLLPVVRGRGAFGRVVEGIYRGERVAVKMLLGPGDGGVSHDSAALMDAFRQEVEVLGRCSHPNVVKLLAACLDPRQPCLVMELCDTSLEALVFKRGSPGAGPAPAPAQMPLATVLTIAVDICNALSYLHPTIIHRDLKPANVLINGAGSGAPVAKLTDFGLARFRAMTQATQDPEAGTVAFMAPECFDIDNSIITHRADLYSLGVLLWVLVTGEQPWGGLPAMAVAYMVCAQGARLPLSGLSDDRCPRKLRRLLVDLWDADPLRRPAAAEVGKELLLLQDQLLREGRGTTGEAGGSA